jgi:hypothetical protein
MTELGAGTIATAALLAIWSGDRADGIIFGTPTRFGNVASELKAFIDSLGGVWFQGKLNGKIGAAFGSPRLGTAATNRRFCRSITCWPTLA